MKKGLIRTNVADWTQAEWLAFRYNGIGGSEVGTLLGLSPYKCATELFYDKLNAPKSLEENPALFFGRYMEEHIADLWQYFDGTAETMFANYTAKKRMRKMRAVRQYIQDKNIAHLFASLDRIITKNQFCIDNPDSKENDEGVLECKTISTYASNYWEHGIPPYYVVQLQTYLLITGLKFGELAMLRDGRHFSVIPFRANKAVQERIVQGTTEFWNLVLMARNELKAHGFTYYEEVPQGHSINEFLWTIEPPADGSQAYEDFISKRFKESGETLLGSEECLRAGRIANAIKKKIKALEDDVREQDNYIKSVMREASVMDFGTEGKITWKQNAKGTRVFRNQLNETEL